jgi:hypothetical protein
MTTTAVSSHRHCSWADCPNKDNEGLKLQRCSRCKVTLYCGTDCQTRDWSQHKIKCFLPGETSSLSAQSTPLRSDRATPDYNKLSQLLQKELQFDLPPERIKSFFEDFLSDSPDEKQLKDLYVAMRCSHIKSEIFSAMNSFPPRLQHFTRQSKDETSAQMLKLVLSKLQPIIDKEMQACAHSWASAKKEFRASLVEDLCTFFRKHNYAPPNEEAMSFFMSNLPVKLFLYGGQSFMTTTTRLWLDSEEFSKCHRSALKEAADFFFESVSQQCDLQFDSIKQAAHAQVQRSIYTSLEATRTTEKLADAAQKAKDRVLTNPTEQNFLEAQRKLHAAQRSLEESMRIAQASKIEAQSTISGISGLRQNCQKPQ